MLWDSLKDLLNAEVTQRKEEGCDVNGFAERIAAANGDYAACSALYDELEKLPVRKDFPYCEPDDYEGIVAASNAKGQDPGFSGRREELLDRLYGAWLGRCAGCALGKPFECFPYVSGNDGMRGYEWISRWLENKPLTGYVPGVSKAQADGMRILFPDSQKEHIRFMETDDDIRYTVLGLILGEQKGNDFTPDDIAQLWRTHLPIDMVYTAEACAYINSLNREITDPQKRWDYYRFHHNPYREWIGAQIRIDHYAYANAGFPQTAARVAFQDASFSHAKNGVYGAMFFAAAIAEAFRGTSPEGCIETGLSVIPVKSRLYEAVCQAIDLAKRAPNEQELFRSLWDAFGQYHHVHTINNAACCVASLLYGQGDFAKSITTAVTCGWDTDCNGATVGSLLGAFLGAKALPADWTEPLRDTLYSAVPDFHPIRISACAERSLALYEKLHGAV